MFFFTSTQGSGNGGWIARDRAHLRSLSQNGHDGDSCSAAEALPLHRDDDVRELAAAGVAIKGAKRDNKGR